MWVRVSLCFCDGQATGSGRAEGPFPQPLTFLACPGQPITASLVLHLLLLIGTRPCSWDHHLRPSGNQLHLYLHNSPGKALFCAQLFPPPDTPCSVQPLQNHSGQSLCLDHTSYVSACPGVTQFRVKGWLCARHAQDVFLAQPLTTGDTRIATSLVCAWSSSAHSLGPLCRVNR